MENKTDQYWRDKLSDDEFRICREKGTEPAFSGVYYHEKAEGTYLCKCCGEALFSSAHKYDSGSGWPSYYAPLAASAVAEHTDSSHGMKRVEVTCQQCGCHLGHVFPDGPQPSGLRYCINSASLSFQPEQD